MTRTIVYNQFIFYISHKITRLIYKKIKKEKRKKFAQRHRICN